MNANNLLDGMNRLLVTAPSRELRKTVDINNSNTEEKGVAENGDVPENGATSNGEADKTNNTGG